MGLSSASATDFNITSQTMGDLYAHLRSDWSGDNAIERKRIHQLLGFNAFDLTNEANIGKSLKLAVAVHPVVAHKVPCDASFHVDATFNSIGPQSTLQPNIQQTCDANVRTPASIETIMPV